MYYASFQQVAVTAVVRDHTAFTIPANVTHVELQSSGKQVRYLLTDEDGLLSATKGMLFLITEPPRSFELEDFKRIRFCHDEEGDGFLNAQFFNTRNI